MQGRCNGTVTNEPTSERKNERRRGVAFSSLLYYLLASFHINLYVYTSRIAQIHQPINHSYFLPPAAVFATVAAARRGPAAAKVLAPSTIIMTPKPYLSASSGT